jgi:hypothetical protein
MRAGGVRKFSGDGNAGGRAEHGRCAAERAGRGGLTVGGDLHGSRPPEPLPALHAGLASTRERLRILECYRKDPGSRWRYEVDLRLSEEGQKPAVRAEVEELAQQPRELLGRHPGLSGFTVTEHWT